MRKKAIYICALFLLNIMLMPAAVYATHNTGTYSWVDGDYAGELQGGIPHGYGSSTYYNGETYTGQWAYGVMNGHGTYDWKDGKLYVGEWVNGHMNGKGLMIYSDGSTFSGQFANDQRTGNGTYFNSLIRVFYNNSQMSFETNPFMAYDRVMIPVRKTFEATGAKVGWDESSKCVKIDKGSTKMLLYVDNTTAKVNGNAVTLDVAPIVYSGRTFVPLRFVTENLGATVEWDNTNNVVRIYSSSTLDVSNDDANTDTTPPVVDNTPDVNNDTANPNLYDYNGHVGPTVTGYVVNGHIELSWTRVDASDFNGYKVVISRNDSTPVYPDNGYLFYITDRNQTSATVDNSSGYNGGDFGGQLTSGQTYYFSITALYSGHSYKVPGNVIVLTYP